MVSTINFDSVADIYDAYVNTDLDIEFFSGECSKTSGEVLELMCGTGRVSIPLLEKGYKLTCVDYMGRMLEVFRKKIEDKNYPVNIIEADVTKLDLKKKFNLIILPFNSFAEILDEDKQTSALQRIYDHLNPGGKFICTLHNPIQRLKSADGEIHKLGRFQLNESRYLDVNYINKYDRIKSLISGTQFYEIYDDENNVMEERELEINFRLIEKKEFEKIAVKRGFKIVDIYGDYKYSEFNENESPFIIWILKK